MIRYLPPTWRFGQKKPHIGFICGFGTTAKAYEPGLKELAKLHPFYVFDILNYSSNGYSGSLSLPRYAQILENVLTEYPHIDTLIGHSLGGGITLQLVLNHPDRIKKIVLVNSLGIKINKLTQIVWRNINDPNPDLFKRLEPKSIPAYTQAYVNNPSYYMKTMELCFQVNLSTKLKNVKPKTCILWTTEDELLPVEIGEKLQAAIPDSEFHTVSGQHNPFQLNADSIASVWEKNIIPFLQQ